MKFTSIINGLFLSSALLAGSAIAAPAMESTTVVQQVKTTTDAQGVQHKTVGPMEKAVPGVEVVYTITTHNVGKLPATDVAVTDAIPAHMTYVVGSAEGQDAVISFSIDGGKTWGKAEDLKVKNADGTLSTAQAKDYTNIRWVIKQMAPGATVSVSYHAVLQ